MVKKHLFLVLIFLLLITVGCKNNKKNNIDPITDNPTDINPEDDTVKLTGISIIDLPSRLSYYYDEENMFEGLRVQKEMSDGTSEEIFDFGLYCEDYGRDNLGKKLVTAEYREFKASFYIEITDYTKKNINNHEDYMKNNTISIESYSLRISDVKYGGSRGKDELVFYTSSNYAKTNEFGYEAAIDKYGVVIDKNVNVTLPEGGYVLSGHGTSKEYVKNINIGDVIIYNTDLFVYSNLNLDPNHDLFMEYNELENTLLHNKFIINKEYNVLVDSLNSINNKLDTIYNLEEENLELIKQTKDELKALSEQLDLYYEIYPNDYEHTYNVPKNVDYKKISAILDDSDAFIDLCKYTDKLYYGGFRNKDTLVYYDNGEYYRERNSFGYELAIDKNNIVIATDVLVDIPEDGYVLSGHGTVVTFLKQIGIGDKVEISDNEINFKRDVFAYDYRYEVNRRNQLVEEIQFELFDEIPHDYNMIYSLVKKCDSYLAAIKCDDCSINNLLYNNKCFENIENILSALSAQLVNNDMISTRGMWYYPFKFTENDNSLEAVKKTVEKIYDMGINEIILTDFYKNYALYKSKYYETYPELENYDYGEYGHDYLKCFITEAHKYGIKITAFTQTFYARFESLIGNHDEYYQLNYDGTKSKGNIYYYDICNDEVQEMLLDIYKLLVTEYDFDRIEYDIIRYPASTLYSVLDKDVITPDDFTDVGYTEYAMNKFMTKYNYTGNLKELILTDKQIRSDWNTFKKDELNDFVRRCSETIRTNNYGIEITAAVLSNYKSASLAHHQDALLWLEEGYIDYAEPMFYRSTQEGFMSAFDSYFGKGYDEKLRVGISVRNTDIDNILDFRQMDYALDNYQGYILFSNAQYFEDELFVSNMKNNHHFDNSNGAYNAIDMIENFYSIINDKKYTDLLDALNELDYEKIVKKLESLSDKKMSKYLLSIVKEF